MNSKIHAKFSHGQNAGDHHNDHRQRSQDCLPCHDQTGDQDRHRHDLLDDGVLCVGLDAPV
jgi:hypothetical protein